MEKDHLQEHLINEFKWFHAHPELSYQEFETTKRIKGLLQAQSIEILDLPLETGLVAIIRGKQTGPIIALRSDIDALPVNEDTDLEYKSTISHKMHACGHDFHLTALYGAAILLKKHEDDIHGTIKLIFQPAEESSLGALKVIETHVLDDVEAIFGIHTASYYPVGTIGIKEGHVTAAVDRFEIRLKGFGTHAADPSRGKDPIVAASALVNALQIVTSRNIDPLAAGLISVTHIEGGATWNVIPEEVFLEGTVRTLGQDIRQLYEKRLKEITKNIAAAYEVKEDIHWIAGPPATNNDKTWSEFAVAVAKNQGFDVVESTVSLGGEDFAFYQESIKGVYIQIGTGETYPNHHPRFQVDIQALAPSSYYLDELARAALLEIEKRGK